MLGYLLVRYCMKLDKYFEFVLEIAIDSMKSSYFERRDMSMEVIICLIYHF